MKDEADVVSGAAKTKRPRAARLGALLHVIASPQVTENKIEGRTLNRLRTRSTLSYRYSNLLLSLLLLCTGIVITWYRYGIPEYAFPLLLEREHGKYDREIVSPV